jgi:hypothetical protein
LRSHLSLHAVAGFALPPPVATPPTVTWAGPLTQDDPVATTLPDGVRIPVSDPRIARTLPALSRNTLPGAPTVDGMPCPRVDRPYLAKGIERSAYSVQWFRFRTDAPVIELSGVLPDGGASCQTLLVNGQLAGPFMLSSARGRGGWNRGTLRIAFPDQRMRDVWIETGLYAAYVKVEAGDIFEASAHDLEPQITVIGDSYLQVKSTTFGNHAGIALELGARLGLRRIATDAVGGTGYWNSGRGLGNLGDRQSAHGADGSTVYLVLAGLNDYGDSISGSLIEWPSRSEYERGVAAYLSGLRAAQPDALIAVATPFCPVPSMSDSTYIANPATNTSELGDFLYKSRVLRESIGTIAGPWVYIDVLMGGGWLNSSGASGDISGLQWLTGGTPAPGTTATNRPGNTNGGGGGGFGGIARIPVLQRGRYVQAPEIRAIGGTGRGLLLSSRLDTNGGLSLVAIEVPGEGFNAGGLPVIEVDTTHELVPAVLGPPELLVAINPDGEYPLRSFAPAGVTPAELNNIPMMLAVDRVHPSSVGVSYFSARLARNLHDAVMAL